MPRWISENTDRRHDLLGFPTVQTQVMDSHWSEKKRELFYIGYLLGENFIRFACPFPCNPPKNKDQKK
jgi:hypothetical protein